MHVSLLTHDSTIIEHSIQLAIFQSCLGLKTELAKITENYYLKLNNIHPVPKIYSDIGFLSQTISLLYN